MNDGSVCFASSFPIRAIDEAAISRLKNKLPLADKRPAAEQNSANKMNEGIQDALWIWRDQLCKSDLRTLLKVSGDTEFTNAELDLAGWVRTYAEREKVSLSTAIDRIFEFLGKYPQLLENYTNGDACFAESDASVPGLNMPFGWNSDKSGTEIFRRARICRAIDPSRDLVRAVIEVQKGDEEVRSKIKQLEAENAALRASMAKGKNSLEAFVGIVQQLGSKDAKYLELKAKADVAKGEPEKQKLYEAMADIMMAKGIGKSVQDRQALTGLFGMMSPTGKYAEVLSAVRGEHGTEIGISSRVVDDTLDAKADRLGNVKAYAAVDALGAIEGPVGSLLDGISSSSEAFPGFTAALYAATVALGAYTAASIGGALLGGGKGGGVLNFLKGKLPGGFAAGAEAGAGGLNSALGMSRKAAPGLLARLAAMGGLPLAEAGFATAGAGVAAAGAVGYGAGSLLNYGLNYGISKTTDSGSLGGLIYDMLHAEKEPVKVVVSVENGNIVAAVNDKNTQTARRN